MNGDKLPTLVSAGIVRTLKISMRDTENRMNINLCRDPVRSSFDWAQGFKEFKNVLGKHRRQTNFASSCNPLATVQLTTSLEA